jgi:hypothetical protein
MLESSQQLLELRDFAVRQHRDWKLRSRTTDLLVQGKWAVLWPDLSVSEIDPTVENLLVEALEDKTAAAASVTPYIECAPTRGTRGDEAERNAQRRRRIFISMMRDSLIEEKQQAWYTDWYKDGACYSIPWVNWNDDERHPFLIRLDPRHAYPLAHNSNDELSNILCIKYRRLVDLVQDRTAAPAVAYIVARMEAAGRKRPESVEEIWYCDDRQWGLAYCAALDSNEGWRYVSPLSGSTANTAIVSWAVDPHDHGLSGCPVIEKARRTPDGEYRGALDVMIPNLKVAHNLMSRLLEDVDKQIYAPDIIENVEDLDEFRPGGLLVGTGAGAQYISTRKPINYEAMQHVGQQLASARNAGAFPQQRSGEFDASIASAKAVTAVMGGYGVQQAWAQRDMALFYRRSLSRLAEFDEAWCGGRKKEITGFDEGELFTDKYDPASFWKGDFRLEVGFHNVGLDEQQHLTRLAVAKNMGGLSRRSFMRKSGMVDNPLTEETEIALEVISDSMLAFAFKQADQGNLDPVIKLAQRIDDDKQTVRQAALDVIRETYAVPEGGAQPGAGGMPGGGDPAAAMLQQRSLEQGGVPGQAAEMPQVSPQLLAMLPKGPRQAMAEQAPGASGP